MAMMRRSMLALVGHVLLLMLLTRNIEVEAAAAAAANATEVCTARGMTCLSISVTPEQTCCQYTDQTEAEVCVHVSTQVINLGSSTDYNAVYECQRESKVYVDFNFELVYKQVMVPFKNVETVFIQQGPVIQGWFGSLSQGVRIMHVNGAVRKVYEKCNPDAAGLCEYETGYGTRGPVTLVLGVETVSQSAPATLTTFVKSTKNLVALQDLLDEYKMPTFSTASLNDGGVDFVTSRVVTGVTKTWTTTSLSTTVGGALQHPETTTTSWTPDDGWRMGKGGLGHIHKPSAAEKLGDLIGVSTNIVIAVLVVLSALLFAYYFRHTFCTKEENRPKDVLDCVFPCLKKYGKGYMQRVNLIHNHRQAEVCSGEPALKAMTLRNVHSFDSLVGVDDDDGEYDPNGIDDDDLEGGGRGGNGGERAESRRMQKEYDIALDDEDGDDDIMNMTMDRGDGDRDSLGGTGTFEGDQMRPSAPFENDIYKGN